MRQAALVVTLVHETCAPYGFLIERFFFHLHFFLDKGCAVFDKTPQGEKRGEIGTFQSGILLNR